MNKQDFLIISSLLFFLLSSCTKEATTLDLGSEINLSNLQEGQTSRYVGYTSQCADMDALFEYTGDTLIVRVLKENDDFYFEESYSPHSKTIQNGRVIEPIRYPVIEEGGKLVLSERTRSRLFNFYGSDDLHLSVKSKLPTLFQNGCRLELRGNPFVGDDITKLNSFKIGPLQVYQKIAVSCVPMIDIDGYLIYDSRQLLMSHRIVEASFNGSTSDGIGGWWLIDTSSIQ